MTVGDPRDAAEEAEIALLEAKGREFFRLAREAAAALAKKQFARARASLGSPSPVPFSERAEAAREERNAS